MAGDKDRFGIPFFYPTKSGGLFYESSDNLKNDKYLDIDADQDVSGNEITEHPNGPTSFSVGKNCVGFKDSIGGCNMDFKETAARGYSYKKDDVRDLEFKCLVKFNNIGDHGFSISACTGHHPSNSDPCCQGFAYMGTAETDTNPVEFAFRKEIYHVNYNDSPQGVWEHPDWNFKLNGHGWIGYGFCRYNKQVGDETHVVLEVWGNPDPDSDITKWKMLKREVDKPGYGWAKDGDECNGDKDQVGTWSGAHNRLKTNATSGSVNIKCITFREIDPEGASPNPDPDPDPDPTPTPIPDPPAPTPTVGTIYRDFTFRYNIVLFPQGVCGGPPDDSIINIFYDVSDTGSASNLHKERYRVGMIPINPSSKFLGRRPRRIRVWLSATGVLPAGDITVVLRKNNGDDVAVTYAYTGGASLNATDLTTTKTEYTFENLTSIYAWQLGDKLLVEYSGNTEDTLNEVNVFRNSLDSFDGINSCAIKFDIGGPPPTSYSPPDTGHDYSWEISE